MESGGSEWYRSRYETHSWNVNGIQASIGRGACAVPRGETGYCVLPRDQGRSINPRWICRNTKNIEFAKKKGYSGTAIFSRIKPLCLTFGLPEDILKKFKLSEDGYGDPNEEGRVITAEFGPPDGGFFVVNVYTPNAKPDLSRLRLRHKQWDPAFLEFLRHLEKKKPVIFCGDLNVAHTPDDLANPKTNEGEHGFTKEEREGVDAILKAGFVDTFRMFTKGNGHYTWWSHFGNARDRNMGWRIDYFFVSKRLAHKVTVAKIYPEVYGSDHCPVSIELDL